MTRGLYVLPLTIFIGSFAWSFVHVSLPFYVQTLAADDPATALRWTGWILGITSLVTVVTAPAWGRLAEHRDPRALYVLVEGLQGAAFFGMAAARTLPELFLARLVLGFMGAASTFAFMIIGRVADEAGIRRHVAAVQSAMTVGQVIGPLAGAIAAARLGFRLSFVAGAFLLFGGALIARWGVPELRDRRRAGSAETSTRPRDVVTVALIVLGGSIHIFFLTAILPQVLPDLGVPTDRTLEVGGMIVFASGAAAALGAVAAPRANELFGQRRLVPALFLGSSLLVAALALPDSAWGYGALRFLQVLCVAPVFPIVLSAIAPRAGGQAIGFINSARIGAGFLGPVLATSVLAATSRTGMYLMLAAIGLACVPLARRPGPTRAKG